MPSAWLQQRLGDRADRDPGGGLAGAGPLQDRPGVGVAVLLHAGQVGVAGPGPGQRGVAGLRGEQRRGRPGRPPSPSATWATRELPTRIATGLPRVQAVPDAADDLDLVLLERHPRAPAVAQPAAGELAADVVGRHSTPAGTPSRIATSAGPCDSPAVNQRNTAHSLARRGQQPSVPRRRPALRTAGRTHQDRSELDGNPQIG